MRLPKLASQFSVFLLALFLYPSSAIPNSSFHGDAAVLISMKASMVDPNHTLDSWRPSNYTAHCSWTGIKCDHIGRVVALNLFHMNISGSFPTQVTKLPALRVLNVSYNFLTGNLPSNISVLRNLEVLDISSNILNGGLLNLRYLLNLRHLDVGGNYLSGSIPVEYGKLKSVEYLSLYGNRLSGGIPGELGNLRNLKTLYLSGNGLSGQIPGELGNLGNLKTLDLSMNTFDGALPSNLGDLKSLEEMFLYSNGLTGPIPPQLGHLVSLKYMYLFNNSLSGEIPVGLSELNELGELDLSLNKLTGSIPPQLGHLMRLKEMILYNNSLSGEIPVGLSELNELGELDLSLNKLTGSIPPQLGHLVSLQYMSLSGNTLSGEIPSFIGDLPNLEYLLMDENNFTGPLPQQLGESGKLVAVDVSSNRLSGPLPVEIARLSTLEYLNVSRNHLNGSIPTEWENVQAWFYPPDFSYNNFSGFVGNGSVLSYFDRKYFVGNPYLCGAQLNPCSSHVNGFRHINLGLVLALVLLFWLLVFGIEAVIIKARAVKKQGDSKPWMMTAFQKLNFESDDIVECIKEENIIGKGGAGVVYRGMMPKGEQIAVKKLMGMGSSNDHGFSAEIETLGRIRHRHIVRLMAICSNHDTNLLVYEYMSNGSLGELLHGNNGRHDLQWNYRYKIALEAAKGLCYLHHHCVPLILHRDVKSSNILLDSNFEAHVADFGLAKFLHRSDISEYMSSVAGTFGYIAPEYANALKLDVKSDVYSYGVVVLELITGKRPVGECEFEEDMNLVGWVKHITKWKREEVMKIMDPKLSSVPVEEAMHLLSVALLCIQEHPHHRPNMRDIVHILTYFPQTKPMESF